MDSPRFIWKIKIFFWFLTCSVSHLSFNGDLSLILWEQVSYVNENEFDVHQIHFKFCWLIVCHLQSYH